MLLGCHISGLSYRLGCAECRGQMVECRVECAEGTGGQEYWSAECRVQSTGVVLCVVSGA